MKRILVDMSATLIHHGHIRLLQRASSLGQVIVALTMDEEVVKVKGYTPEIPFQGRREILEAIKYVDEVYMYQTEEELYDLIKFFKPDIRILGEDYIGKSFTGDDLPPKVIYTTRSHEWSTTRLKDMITLQTLKQNPDIAKMIR